MKPKQLAPEAADALRQLKWVQRRITVAGGKLDDLRAARLGLYRCLMGEHGVSSQVLADAIGRDRSAITVAVRRADARAAAMAECPVGQAIVILDLDKGTS